MLLYIFFNFSFRFVWKNRPQLWPKHINGDHDLKSKPPWKNLTPRCGHSLSPDFIIWTNWNLQDLMMLSHNLQFKVISDQIFEKIYKYLIYPNYLPMKKSMTFYFNKFEFYSPSCQVLLKLTQWFWRGYQNWKKNGQTDEGQNVNRKAHLHFQLKWAQCNVV